MYHPNDLHVIKQHMLVTVMNRERDWECEEFHLPFTKLQKNLMFFYYVRRYFDENPHPKYEIIMDLEDSRCKKLKSGITQQDLVEYLEARVSLSDSWESDKCQQVLDNFFTCMQEQLPYTSWEEATGHYCVLCPKLPYPCERGHGISKSLLTLLLLPGQWIPFNHNILLFPLRKYQVNLTCDEYSESKGFLLNKNTQMLWSCEVSDKTIHEPRRIDEKLRIIVDFLLTNPLVPKANFQDITVASIYSQKKLTQVTAEDLKGLPKPLRSKIKQIYKVAYIFNWCTSWKSTFNILHSCSKGTAKNILDIPCPNGGNVHPTESPHHDGHFHPREHPDSKNFWFGHFSEKSHLDYMQTEDYCHLQKHLLKRQELIHTCQEMIKDPNLILFFNNEGLQKYVLEHVRKVIDNLEVRVYDYVITDDIDDFDLPTVPDHVPATCSLYNDQIPELNHLDEMEGHPLPACSDSESDMEQ